MSQPQLSNADLAVILTNFHAEMLEYADRLYHRDWSGAEDCRKRFEYLLAVMNRALRA